MSVLLGAAALLGALWWAIFGLKPYAMDMAQMQSRYALPQSAAAPAQAAPVMQRSPVEGQWAEDLRFRSFDGSEVYGRIRYPSDPAQAKQPFPVLLALQAMGRTQKRWWQAEFKGRPTIESTHLLTELALRQGYAVIALDARLHGERKVPGLLPTEMMEDLHWWGQREPYERMVVDSVRDWRLLLDWVQQQPQLDAGRVQAAGYSMGAQMALLLGGLDARVHAVAAIVPPHLDNKVAAVAPINAVAGLAGKKVWLITADDDDHASPAQNAALFAAIPAVDKQHQRWPGGHLLPPTYVPQLRAWF